MDKNLSMPVPAQPEQVGFTSEALGTAAGGSFGNPTTPAPPDITSNNNNNEEPPPPAYSPPPQFFNNGTNNNNGTYPPPPPAYPTMPYPPPPQTNVVMYSTGMNTYPSNAIRAPPAPVYLANTYNQHYYERRRRLRLAVSIAVAFIVLVNFFWIIPIIISSAAASSYGD